MSQAIYMNLESWPWIVVSGPDINPVPPDLYVPTVNPDGSLRVTNYSTAAFGAALVAVKPLTPTLESTTWVKLNLSMEAFISSLDMENFGRLELDSKLVLQVAPAPPATIRNVANFSSQVNFSTGQWEIDQDPPGWTPTGFTPSLPTNKWFPIEFSGSFTTTTFSFISAKFGSQIFYVPTSLQNVPLEPTDWTDLVDAIQIQVAVMTPGVISPSFRNITATFAS